MAGWPIGFWESRAIDAFRLVAIRDLPRTRETLLFRLMGAGRTWVEAYEDLARLPKQAWERQAAMPAVLELIQRIGHDWTGAKVEEKHIVKVLEDFWKDDRAVRRRIREEIRKDFVKEGERLGRARAARRMVRAIYEERFGDLPPDIAAVLRTTRDPAVLEGWVLLAATRTARQLAAAIRKPAAA